MGMKTTLAPCRGSPVSALGGRARRPKRGDVFAQTKKKLFFSCFSSSIHRIRLAMELGYQHGRKVAIVGRSLDNSTEIAQDLGYLDVPQGLVINPGQIRDFPANKLLIMISGTQGEPMSALSRAAGNNQRSRISMPGIP